MYSIIHVDFALPAMEQASKQCMKKCMRWPKVPMFVAQFFISLIFPQIYELQCKF